MRCWKCSDRRCQVSTGVPSFGGIGPTTDPSRQGIVAKPLVSYEIQRAGVSMRGEGSGMAAVERVLAEAVLGDRAELPERPLFELSDALVADAEFLGDLLEGPRCLPAEAEPQPQDFLLARGEMVEQ